MSMNPANSPYALAWGFSCETWDEKHVNEDAIPLYEKFTFVNIT